MTTTETTTPERHPAYCPPSCMESFEKFYADMKASFDNALVPMGEVSPSIKFQTLLDGLLHVCIYAACVDYPAETIDDPAGRIFDAFTGACGDVSNLMRDEDR